MGKFFLKPLFFSKKILCIFLLTFCLLIVLFSLEKLLPVILEKKVGGRMPEGVVCKVEKINFNWFKDKGASAQVSLKSISKPEIVFANLYLKNSLKDLLLDENFSFSFCGKGEGLGLPLEFSGDFDMVKTVEKTFDGSVQFHVEKISSEYLASNFFNGNESAFFLGESLVAEGEAKNLFSEKIEYFGSVYGAAGRVDADFIIERRDGLSVSGKNGNVKINSESPLLSKSFFNKFSLLEGIRINQESFNFEFFDYKIPLNDDLSKLNGKGLLNLGSFFIDSGPSIFSFLDIFESDNKVVLAEVPAIEIDLVNGVAEVKEFVIDIDKIWKMPLLGTIDLNRKKVDMISEIDARAVAPRFLGIDEISKISHFLELGVMVKLKIEGPFNDVQVNLDPQWDPGQTALRHIPTVFDEVLKNSKKITDEIEKLGEGLKNIFD